MRIVAEGFTASGHSGKAMTDTWGSFGVKKIVLLLVICLFGQGSIGEACTTILVTKGATANGSTFITHSNDSGSCDPSIVYVPARNNPSGSMRNVYPSAIAIDELPQYNCYMTPRLVDKKRAPGYAGYNKTDKNTIPLGAIPEAKRTYAYIDSDYAVMNEHGLMFGECTNHSRVESDPQSGKGIFYASELARVALERCRTAREAVVLMGELIDTYGLYGTGETLLVADKDEGWVFEMAVSPDGKGGLWVAQRVPDGEVFVAANQFRIREISVNNPNQIFNPNMIDVLQQAGWAVWDEKSGELDWLRSMDGVEDVHPYFSLRRVWRTFSLIAPSKNFAAKVQGPFTREYPFSVKPDKLLELEDLTAIHRDSYEGTEFDMTIGVAAGQFGSPYRKRGGDDGAWERPINTQITNYTWIAEYNPAYAMPVAWIALGRASDSVFVPVTVSKMPTGYEMVDRRVYNMQKPWWIYMQLSEFTSPRHGYTRDDMQAMALKYETSAKKYVQSSKNIDKEVFAAQLRQNAKNTARDWQRFYETLVIKYNQDKGARPADKWYEESGYKNGPMKY